MKYFTCIMSAAAAAALLPALAHAAEGGWTERDFGLTDQKKVVAPDDPSATSIINGVYAGSPEETGIMFYCIDGELSATVAVRPYDFSQGMGSTSRVKARTVEMYANGEKVQSSYWTYLPSLGLARAQEHEAKAKLFNAVVRDEEVRIKASTIGEVDIVMPPVDETFTAFAQECGF